MTRLFSLLTVICVLALNPTSYALDEQDARDDYLTIPGHGSYKWNRSRIPWEEAQATCRSEGANLWVINSQAEWMAVQDHVGFAGVSIGVHRVNTGGAFVTVHGQSLDQVGYVHWQSGQPEGDSATKPYVFFARNAGMCTDTAEDRLSFICEK